MVQIAKPAFNRDRWTHVLFTFANANTGKTNGIGKLYLNGELAGQFSDWDLSVNWDPEQMLFTIGALYVGLFDELALFNRSLTETEARMLYCLNNGVQSLLKK